VGLPNTYVGDDDGAPVGLTVGARLGIGVGLPATYVGAVVGLLLGDPDGANDGSGVGLPALYVGDRVGACVGLRLGLPRLQPPLCLHTL